MKTYKITIFRYNPEQDTEPHPERYTIEAKEGWTVLDALNEIKWHQDGTLSYRRSCRHGICGSCAMTIDGVNRLACETQLTTLGSEFVVEPLRHLKVIKDLIVDMNPMYEKLLKIKPYFIEKSPPPSDHERRQSPGERRKLDGLYECILCGSCTSSCPSFWADGEYLGPHAFLKVNRFVADSRDQGKAERLTLIDNRHGLWRCHTIFNCVEACPKSLNPTRAISKLKRALVTGKL